MESPEYMIDKIIQRHCDEIEKSIKLNLLNHKFLDASSRIIEFGISYPVGRNLFVNGVQYTKDILNDKIIEICDNIKKCGVYIEVVICFSDRKHRFDGIVIEIRIKHHTVNQVYIYMDK